MQKHAYLIMCHDNFDGLTKLLSLVDDTRNDIYIHVDKKAKGFHESKIKDSVRQSKVIFIPRINVAWGGYSLVKAELALLKAAVKGSYCYYHLLSGNDLPLRSQDEIHHFFEEHRGLEFISIDETTEWGNDFSSRVNHYHFLQDYTGRSKGIIIGLLDRMEMGSLSFQRHISVNRQKNKHNSLYKGGTWFSITDNMVRYILQNEKFIKANFQYGLCVDELFLQTVAMRSPYRKNITGECQRYIDWTRGKPYTFTDEDFDLLMNSKKLFARKFDYSKYPEIVDRITNHLLGLKSDY